MLEVFLAFGCNIFISNTTTNDTGNRRRLFSVLRHLTAFSLDREQTPDTLAFVSEG
jgi:hypothetical protein